MTGVLGLAALEQRLAPLSHGAAALDIVREALGQVGKGARQAFLNEHLLRAAIRYDDARTYIDPPPELFHVLQGDIIRTESAYVLDGRQVGDRSYAVATATCDAVPGRRETVLLLPVEPRRTSDYDDRGRLRNNPTNLVAFRTTRYCYLPPLPDDPPEVLFNIVLFDPFAQCANVTLATVERRASMTLLGWRIFGALLRSIQVREAADEAALRML